ncbi:MAG: N-methyl-D-aspartate receptor NMDAR2C subunit [Gemmatimonadales bacterium]
MTDPRARLAGLLVRLGAFGDSHPVADAVVAAWSEPARRHHDLDHLRDCLAELDQAPTGGGDRDRVEAALWFHDAVYDPRAADNEARSAEWARTAFAALGIAPSVADDVARLVFLTRHTDPAPDPAGRLLCDIDLAVLGRDADAFDEYERRVREEYGWVPEDEFRTARRRILTGLLDRQSVYLTPYFHGRLEAGARRNLARSLVRLGDGLP